MQVCALPQMAHLISMHWLKSHPVALSEIGRWHSIAPKHAMSLIDMTSGKPCQPLGMSGKLLKTRQDCAMLSRISSDMDVHNICKCIYNTTAGKGRGNTMK